MEMKLYPDNFNNSLHVKINEQFVIIDKKIKGNK